MPDIYDNPFENIPTEFFQKYITNPESKTEEEKDFISLLFKELFVTSSDSLDESIGATEEYKAMMRKSSNP